MPDQCSTCFFGQRTATVPTASTRGTPDELVLTTRVCCHNSPVPINVGSGPEPVLFAPVADDHWCGDGRDNATGRPFTAVAPAGGYTVATLPPSQPGLRLFVSDSRTSNFGAAVNGGGTNFVPVYGDNHGNWLIG